MCHSVTAPQRSYGEIQPPISQMSTDGLDLCPSVRSVATPLRAFRALLPLPAAPTALVRNTAHPLQGEGWGEGACACAFHLATRDSRQTEARIENREASRSKGNPAPALCLESKLQLVRAFLLAPRFSLLASPPKRLAPPPSPTAFEITSTYVDVTSTYVYVTQRDVWLT